MKRAVVKGEPLYRFSFGHAETIMPIVSWFGAYPAENPDTFKGGAVLTPDSTADDNVIPFPYSPDRSWKGSLIVPFAAHLSLALWRSTDDAKPALVQLLLNGQSLQLPKLQESPEESRGPFARYFYPVEHFFQFLRRSAGRNETINDTGRFSEL